MANGKVFNRSVDIYPGSNPAVTVNGSTVIDKDGKVVADITAPAGSIGTAELAASAVTAAKLATDAVETAKIKDANVTVAKLATDAVETAKIKDANVTLAKLATGITPSHVVKFAGTTEAYGGGGTSNAFTVTGAAATDVASAVIRASTNAVSITKAVLTTNTLTVHFSADPGAATTVDYVIYRAAA